jgi:hypothetical protein
MKKLLVWVLVLVLLTPCLALAEGGSKVIVYRQEGDTIVFDIAHAETIVNMTVDRADASRYVDMPEAGLTFHHFGFMSRDTAQDASILYYFTNPRGLSASFYAPQPGHVREEQTSGQKAIINGMDASVSISHMSYESQVLMTMLTAWVQVSDDDMVYCTLSYKGDSQNDLLLMLNMILPLQSGGAEVTAAPAATPEPAVTPEPAAAPTEAPTATEEPAAPTEEPVPATEEPTATEEPAAPTEEPEQTTEGTSDSSAGEGISGRSATTVKSTVNIRSKPDKKSTMLVALKKGRKMIVLEEVTNAKGETWYHVQYERADFNRTVDGYVRTDMVELDP